jgi:quercetin dioxygenase-like cupin family protein
MSYSITHVDDVPAERGPHPAASIFDKRVSAELGLARLGLYQIDLPPWATTEPHDHVQDEVEDAYAVIRGNGWVIVDGQEVGIEVGQFVGVTKESNRFIRAGEDGCVLIAVCA